MIHRNEGHNSVANISEQTIKDMADSATPEPSNRTQSCNCMKGTRENQDSPIDVILKRWLQNSSADPFYFPDWRIKFASSPPPWSYTTIVTARRKSSDPSAPCLEMRHDLKWTGDWWGELTPDIASCCSRCRKRNSSVAFSYVSDDCLLFTRVTGDVQDPGSVSALVDSYPAPPDCRTLGTPCDCPPSTWAAAIAHDLPDCAAACELLAGRQLVAAGDSLVRDTWTALALWLLVVDGVDVVLRAGPNHHAACLACAWKMLVLLGVKRDLEARGLLVEGPPETRTYTLSACGGAPASSSSPRRASPTSTGSRPLSQSTRGGARRTCW